ncbi:MAG: hypothetical protein LC775_05590, partial [Acidobacteria bacterium]|nr:hypothetical protein [Acidobacteriota bacterium]
QRDDSSREDDTLGLALLVRSCFFVEPRMDEKSLVFMATRRRSDSAGPMTLRILNQMNRPFRMTSLDRLSLALERAADYATAAHICQTGWNRFSKEVQRFKYAEKIQQRGEKCRKKLQQGQPGS